MGEDTLASILDDLDRTRDIPGWSPHLPPHLSPTSMNQVEKCPELFRQVYVLGNRERPNGSMLWGRADSAAAHHNFAQKITSGEDVPVSEVKDAFAAALDEGLDEVGGESEVEWKDSSRADTLDRGVALAALYHTQVAPSVQPVASEERFEIEVPGLPVPVVGVIDAGTVERTIERKTAAQMSRVIKPDWRVQTLVYQLATSRQVDVHLSTKTKTPAVYTPAELPDLSLPLELRNMARAERVVVARGKLIVALLEAFGPDEPWPDAVSDGSWNHGVCRLCGFREKGCVYWA